MGDNAGYRIREGDTVSHLIRRQWQVDNIEELITDVAETLMKSLSKSGIGGETVALRHDLGIGRLTAALYHAVYEPPFNRIESDPVKSDISDNGLYEIELVTWDHWKIWNYAIGWRDDDQDIFDPILIAEVRFTEGESLPDGMEYKVVDP